MKIGNIDLGPKPLLLALWKMLRIFPSAASARAGADMVYTEFVPSRGLVRDASKAIAKMHTIEEEAPVGDSRYMVICRNMVDAAKMADRALSLPEGMGRI